MIDMNKQLIDYINHRKVNVFTTFWGNVAYDIAAEKRIR